PPPHAPALRRRKDLRGPGGRQPHARGSPAAAQGRLAERRPRPRLPRRAPAPPGREHLAGDRPERGQEPRGPPHAGPAGAQGPATEARGHRAGAPDPARPRQVAAPAPRGAGGPAPRGRPGPARRSDRPRRRGWGPSPRRQQGTAPAKEEAAMTTG